MIECFVDQKVLSSSLHQVSIHGHALCFMHLTPGVVHIFTDIMDIIGSLSPMHKKKSQSVITVN